MSPPPAADTTSTSHGPMEPLAFLRTTLVLLGLPADPALRAERRASLEARFHPTWQSEVSELVTRLVDELPTLLQARHGSPDYACYETIARTYSMVTLNAWVTAPYQAPIGLFVAPTLWNYLTHPDSTPPPPVLALTLLLSSDPETGLCGFQPYDLVCRSTKGIVPILTKPNIEATDSAPYRPFFRSPEKCAEFEQKLACSDFPKDWQTLRRLFPEETAADLLHGGIPETAPHFAPFTALCWKYCLFGVRADGTPILAQPLVRQTAFGTEIFIPTYLSVDFKRDFDLGAIADYHRARRVRRQGESFSPGRTAEIARAAHALAADTEARALGLRGDRRFDHIRQKLGLPAATDDAVINRLLRLAKNKRA